MDIEEFHEYYRDKYGVKHHHYQQIWRILLELLMLFGLAVLMLLWYVQRYQGR